MFIPKELPLRATLLPILLPTCPAVSTATACLNISFKSPLSAFFTTSFNLFFANCLAIKYPPPPPTANDVPASRTDGSASPNPPAKNLAASPILSQRTSVARDIDGPPCAASARNLADFSIRLSDIPSRPTTSAASPPIAVALLSTPSTPRPNPAPTSLSPPSIPSLPSFGALSWS